jgi:cobalt-zinc-cadmium efflux system protein
MPDHFGRAFAIGALLNIAFVAIELGYGFVSNSLALIADAAHNFSDVIGLLMAWAAHALRKRAPTRTYTYGYLRASILASVANAGLLLGAVALIGYQAVTRFINPQDVETGIVGWVAAIGIVINLGTALMFLRGRKDDININGAFLHMAADAGVSLGVVAGAVLIAATGMHWIDPVLSLIIAAVILVSSWDLARKSLGLAMDAVPHGIDRGQVETFLSSLPGVTSVHDLHIWAMGTTENALTVHLVRPGHGLDDAFLMDTCKQLNDRFNISHATIQIEAGVQDCPLQPEDRV